MRTGAAKPSPGFARDDVGRSPVPHTPLFGMIQVLHRDASPFDT